MKLKVYSKKAAENAKEGQLFLRLKNNYDGDVSLIVVDKKGELIPRGNILYISNGVIIGNGGISDDIPLKTDICDTVLFYTDLEASKIDITLRKKMGIEKEKHHSMNEILSKIFDKS